MAEEDDDPRRELREGLGHLAKAARGAASRLKSELGKARESTTRAATDAASKASPATTALTGALEDAGRELARAAGSVLGRLGELATGAPEAAPPRVTPSPVKVEPEGSPGEKAKPATATGAGKPKGPTDEDPGFHIAGGSKNDPGGG